MYICCLVLFILLNVKDSNLIWLITPNVLSEAHRELPWPSIQLKVWKAAGRPRILSVKIDVMNCGVDDEADVPLGKIPIVKYPWLGILYYQYFDGGAARATTTVILIQKEFVLAAAADIEPMPKHNFRASTRVLLGEDWTRGGRRVRNYVIHPESEQTMNTVALVQLKDIVREINIKPICPPPDFVRSPDFFVVKFSEDYNNLKKEVIPVTHVPGYLCKEFYIAANLYSKKLRPPKVACVVQLDTQKPCVWNAGAALVTRDVWGRWQLLGLGVRGPGCGMPSRYLDMMSYYPWVHHSISQFERITISKINKQKYVLRSAGGGTATQRFGACDPEEKKNLIYREVIVLRTDNTQYQFLTYNMTIFDNIEYTCLTLEMVNASAVSEMNLRHKFPRIGYAKPCYRYHGTVFEISVYIMFSDKCLFEMFAWGFERNMTLMGLQEWKWEEGTYYMDFTPQPVEYRGQTYQTEFGFEPVDESLWLPDFDIWASTEPPNVTTEFELPEQDQEEEEVADQGKLTEMLNPEPIEPSEPWWYPMNISYDVFPTTTTTTTLYPPTTAWSFMGMLG